MNMGKEIEVQNIQEQISTYIINSIDKKCGNKETLTLELITPEEGQPHLILSSNPTVSIYPEELIAMGLILGIELVQKPHRSAGRPKQQPKRGRGRPRKSEATA
jgi:hypothetical protein